MARRTDRTDPVVAQLVRERLAHLLAENSPRRATPQLPRSSRAALIDGPAFDPIASSATTDSAPSGGDPESLGQDWALRSPRRSFSRAHVGVVVAVIVAALACASWAVLRARPVAVAGPLITSAAPAPATGVSSAAAPKASPTPVPVIVVHVLGAVRHPGVVTLSERARVRDAIARAGGLADNADPGQLNLAQLLSDGQQIVIGTKKDPAGDVRDGTSQVGTGTKTTGTPGGTDQVNLNGATQVQLEALPGIGPVTAAKIIAWRTEHGRFSRVEELQEVAGIGPKTYAEIAPHVRV